MFHLPSVIMCDQSASRISCPFFLLNIGNLSYSVSNPSVLSFYEVSFSLIVVCLDASVVKCNDPQIYITLRNHACQRM
jgi:hypothetical protein